MHSSSVLSIVLVAACSGGSDRPPAPDAPPPIPVVVLSSCPSTVDATVMDSPSMFVPAMTNVGVGSVVKFSINAEHFVIPHLSLPTDQLLKVSRGETKCFRFDVAGTYNFVCGVHSFVGQIIVQ